MDHNGQDLSRDLALHTDKESVETFSSTTVSCAEIVEIWTITTAASSGGSATSNKPASMEASISVARLPKPDDSVLGANEQLND